MKIENLHICMPSARAVMEVPAVVSLGYLFHQLGHKHRSFHFTQPTHTIVGTARQICVNVALADKDCTHLVFIDDDMTYGHEQYFALEEEMLTNDLDFLSALAFSNDMPTKPCVFGKVKDVPVDGVEPWWSIVTGYPRKQRFEVYASGFGMCLISRRMLEAMQGDVKEYQHFYYSHPKCMNEDIAFCLNARSHGFKLYCDSRVSIGHISKDKPIVSQELFDGQGDALEYGGGLQRMEFTDGPVAEYIKALSREERDVFLEERRKDVISHWDEYAAKGDA